MIKNLFANISLIKTTAILVAVVFISLISIVAYFIYTPVAKGDLSSVEINIESGNGLKIVAQKLYDHGLIRSELLFVFYVKARGYDDDLKAGRYLFSKSTNIPTIALLIVSGGAETEDIEITIPEGLNIWEIDQKLVQAGLILEGEFSSKYYQEEGYLFPDTYRLKKILNPKSEILNPDLVQELREKMRENFKSKTEELLSVLGGSASGGKNLSTEKQKEVIIIASILEKEAKTEEDMRLIAGIIQNRLSIGMPLEVDASVVYGACIREARKTNYAKNCYVTFQGPAVEIKTDSPYNAYMWKGLPIGPISNPGLKAIEAALNPQFSDYLFYLSTRDGSQIIYSKTSTEHTANRRRYLGI